MLNRNVKRTTAALRALRTRANNRGDAKRVKELNKRIKDVNGGREPKVEAAKPVVPKRQLAAFRARKTLAQRSGDRRKVGVYNKRIAELLAKTPEAGEKKPARSKATEPKVAAQSTEGRAIAKKILAAAKLGDITLKQVKAEKAKTNRRQRTNAKGRDAATGQRKAA